LRHLLFLFSLPNFFLAQTNIELKGELICANASIENIHIINLSNKKTTISDAHGKFTIEAKEDDLLVFSAIHIDYWRQSVKENDVKNKTIIVKLTVKIEKLEEVVVENKVEVTAQEMGIIDYKPISYTPAERKLKTATDWNGQLGLGTILGFGFSLDPILNWASGRTKLLKNELKIEQKELAIKKLNAYFDEDYFSNTLKIPLEYHEGFKFFAVEHENLYNNLQDKNKNQAKFSLAEIAQDFLEFLKNKP
jgi:hypothetical protein